jgi:hypothetical protein
MVGNSKEKIINELNGQLAFSPEKLCELLAV